MTDIEYPFERQQYDSGIRGVLEDESTHIEGLHELIDTSSQPGVMRKYGAVLLLGAVGAYKLLTMEGTADIIDSMQATPGVQDIQQEGQEQNVSPEKLEVFYTHLNALLDEISKGEGTYNSINRGVAGDTPEDSEAYASLLGGRKLTELTIAEVLDLQNNHGLFATGRWQIVRGTLGGAAHRTRIDVQRNYDESAQRELATNLIMGGDKRPILTAYIKGEDVTVEAALNDLCHEWAGVPNNDGYGCYDNDRAKNKAHGGLERAQHMKALLTAARESYIALTKEEATPPPTPLVTFIGDSLSVGYDKFGALTEIDVSHNFDVLRVDALESRPLTGNDISGLRAIETNADAIAISDITVIGLGTNAVETDKDYGEAIAQAITRIKELTKDNPHAKIAFIENYSYAEGSKSAERRNRRNEILNTVIDPFDDVFLLNIKQEALDFSGDKVHLSTEATGYRAATEQIATQLQHIASA